MVWLYSSAGATDWAEDLSVLLARHLGAISEADRIFFVKSAIRELFIGASVALVIAVLLQTGRKYSVALSLSLILAMPIRTMLAWGIHFHPLNVRLGLFYLKAMIVPVFVCCLLMLLLFELLRRRNSRRSEVTSACRSRLLARIHAGLTWVVLITYFGSAAYGWYEIKHFSKFWLNQLQ